MKKRTTALIAFLLIAAIYIAHHFISGTQNEVIAPTEPPKTPRAKARPHPNAAPEPPKTETIAVTVQESAPEALPEKYVLENMPAGSSIMPPPDFHPRPEGEWQGMLIDMNLRPMCETTAQCGRALSCREGHCLPCLEDRDCDVGESCVLDHCVRQEFIGCRTRADCHQDSLCILSGYSDGPRGNIEMKALCMETSGGQDIAEQDLESAAHEESEGAPEEISPAARETERYRQNLIDSARAACPDC